MRNWGHAGKTWIRVGTLTACLFAANQVRAAVKSWANSGNGSSTLNFSASANWTGGLPGNGDDAFMVWNGGSPNHTKIITNAATDVFIANSLSITNVSTRATVNILLRGQVFLTNGPGALIFAGSTGNPITLNFSNSVTFNVATFTGQSGDATLTFAAGSVTGSNITFTGGAGVNSFIISAPIVNLSSNLTMTGGNANNTLVISNSTMTVAGRLSVAGNTTDQYFSLTNASMAVSNGVFNTGKIDILNRGTFNVVPVWTNNGVLNIAAGGLVTGGTITNQSAGTISGAGVINTLLVNQGRVNFGGTISNSYLQTAGSFTLSGNATVTGGVSINGGTVNFLGNRLTAAEIVVGTSGNLSNSVTGATISGGVTNAGNVGFLSDMYVLGPVTNTGTWFHRGVISNEVVNSGTLSLFKNSINPRVTGGIVNSGSLIFDNNNAPLVDGSVTNTGSVAFNGTIGGNYVQTAGTLTMTAQGNGAINGTASISGGTLDLAGKTLTNGLLVISGTGLLTNNTAGASLSGTISNAATIAVTANTFFKGVITNTGNFFLQGAVSNSVANSGLLALTGSATITGPLRNTGDVTVNNGTLALNVAPTQLGTVTVGASGILSNVQAWANSGTLVLAGGNVAGGTLTNLGSLTGSGFIKSALVNQGSMGFAGAVSNSFTQTSTGSLTLSGNATFTGTTIANAGTIALSSGQTLTFSGTTFSNAATAVLQNAGGTVELTSSTANFIMTAGTGSNAFNFASGTLLYSGAAGSRTLTLASADLGTSFSATNNNYFISNLRMTGGASYTLTLAGSASSALYVDTITLASGATLDLAGKRVYYATAQNLSGVTFLNGTSADIIQLGSGGLYVFLQTSGTHDYDTAGNWDRGLTPVGAADQVRITTASATSVLATQNTALASFTIQDLIISNGGGGVSTLLAQRNQTWSNGGTIDGGGKIIVSNNVVLTADITVNGGTLNNNGTVNGLITVAGGTADGRYTNSGFIVVNSGTLGGFILNQAAGTITNQANGVVASSGILTNAGLFVNFGGVSNRVVNTANLDLRGGDVRGLLVNTSVISFTNGTASVSGGITNASTGLINLRSTGTLTGGTITNIGTISTLAGGNVDADIVNTTGGAIQGTNGTLRLGGKVTNLGNLNVTNTTWNAVGGISNAAGANIFLRNTGTLNGSTITNLGNIAAVAGGNVGAQVINTGSGVIRGTNQTLNLSGGLVNQSLLLVGNSSVDNATVVVANAASGVFDNSGGEVRFQSSNIGLDDASVLIVSNTYISSSTSVMSNYNNRAAILNFAANRVVTNSGTMAFTFDIIKGASVDIDTNLVLIVASGSNTFYNAGTFIAAQRDNQTGGGGSYPPASLVFSSQFVNAGSVLLTNVGANKSRDLFFTVTGGTVTNEATGTMRFVVIGQPATINMIVERGGFVNAGSLTFMDAPSTTTNLTIILSQAGATFSNAPGGQIILGTGNQGTVQFNADNYVNAGTNLLRGGTLRINNRTGGAGFMANSGTILFSGGFLDANTFTNTGTISGFGGMHKVVNNNRINATNGTLSVTTSIIQNGTVDIAAGGTLSITPAWANSGSIFMNGGILSAGTTTNAAAGIVQGFGTVLDGFVNLGTVTATNGTLSFSTGLGQTNTANVAGGATLSAGQAWRNSGSLNLLGGTVIGSTLTNAGTISGAGTITSTIVNNSGATITASGGGTLTLTAAPLQNGTVNILGTLNVTSAWSNGSAGIVNLSGGVLTGATFTVDGTVKGNGTIAANMIVSLSETVTVNGGQMNLMALTTMNGGVFDGGPVINYGTVSGFGTMSTAVSNPGYILATNGTLRIQMLTGNQATGTLEASAGATLQANGITAWLNNGQVILSGGTIIGGDISNNAARVISGAGTIAETVINSGTVLANNANQALTLNDTVINLAGGTVKAGTGNLIINGAFTNSGTFSMIQSRGTFNGTVVNSGAWITDPTTNVFNNTFTVTASGFIQQTAGDVYIFTNNATTVGNFVNISTNNAQYDTLPGKFLFANTLGLTQDFYVAGHNLGPAVGNSTNTILSLNPSPFSMPEYQTNFALGTLEISDFTTVRVSDAFSLGGPAANDGLTAALYLNNLFMGQNSLLIISSNVQVYFINSNNWTAANFFLEGNPTFNNSINGIHQFLLVPEPNVLVMWLCGIATIYAARRRRPKDHRKQAGEANL